MDTFYMDEYCGSTIDMILMDEFTGRLAVDETYVGDCNVTVETWYTNNRLNFYFEKFGLGAWKTDCHDTFLTVYDGQDPAYSPLMHGLHKRCGQEKPTANFASSGRYVTFRYFNTDTTNNNHFDIIFTAFHKGYCFSYEYECSNGRCIDDSVNCNGFNPCGDGSDCRLGTWAIVGIIIGSLFFICVCSTLTYIIVRARRNRRQISGATEAQPFVKTTYEVAPAATIRPMSPPPNYGMATQYSTATTYNTVTSIQGDT